MNIRRIPCKKCLISKTGRTQVYKEVRDYIASLDESIKTTEEIYQSRLAVCQKCSDLSDGMCAQCGCFIEVRAIKKGQKCPSKQW